MKNKKIYFFLLKVVLHSDWERKDVTGRHGDFWLPSTERGK